ncbi:MAG TPA: hypothetical protein DCW35_05855 [Polynucleobacter sp.]|nr:hypothetical protein [Polynucleobacter sp.]
MVKSRLQKLIKKIKPAISQIYCIGWKDCTWSKSEDLVRSDSESKEDFCSRVYQATKKQYIWFD